MDNTETPFDISVEHNGGTYNLEVIPKLTDDGKEVIYEILDAGNVWFKLQCCTDEVRDSLDLSPEYKDDGIDPELVRKVAEIVESEEM